MCNITNQQVLPKKVENKDKEYIKEYLKENFGYSCGYDSIENMVYIKDNSVLTEPKFLKLLAEFKLIILPSLFNE